MAGKGNPDLTEYPLGLLLARGTIDDTQHRAACEFAWLYHVTLGRPSIASSAYDGSHRGGGNGWDDGALKRFEGKLDNVRGALKAISRQHYDALLNVAVYERTPKWMEPAHFRTAADVTDSRRFSEALVAVAAALGHGRGAR
jgi:hypothetical protein